MRLSLDDALVADELLRVHMSASPSPSMMMSSMHSGSHHMRLSLDDALVAVFFRYTQCLRMC